MSYRHCIATAVVISLTLACENPPAVAGSTSLRLEQPLTASCLQSELAKQPGVSKVSGSDPIRFRFAPRGESEGYEFQLNQRRVGLEQGWLFTVSGKVRKGVVDPDALVQDLGPEVEALRDALANGCGGRILPAS